MSAPVVASTSDRGCCAADYLRSEHRQQLSPTSQVPNDCCDLREVRRHPVLQPPAELAGHYQPSGWLPQAL